MAEETKKINIVELDIEQEQALSDLTELQRKIQETKDDTNALTKTNKDLSVTNEKAAKQYQKNSKQIELNKTNVKGLNKEYSTQQKVVNDVLQVEKKELGTLEKLTLRNKELREELRGLNLETEDGTKRQKEIVTEIDENTDTIKENSDSLVQAKMNVGNYTEGIENSIPALRGMVGGLKTATRAAKAFLATPIGIIIAAAAVAIGLLIKGFQRSQMLADKMKVANAGLRASFDVIIDRVSIGMEKAFKKLREDPVQAIKDVGKAIVTNLVNRVKAMPQIFIKAFEAVKFAITGNMDEAKESVKELGQAFIQLETGMDVEQQEKLKEKMEDLTEEMLREKAAAEALKQADLDLRDLEIEMLVVTAELTKEREKAKLATRDDTLSIEGRLAAQDRAIALDKQLLQVEMGMAKERARISQERVDMGKSLTEDFRENAEAQAEVTRLESAYFTRSKELASERLSLSNMLKAEETARAEAVKQALLEEAQALEVFVNNEIEIWKLRNESAVTNATDLTQELLDAEDKRLKDLEIMRVAAVEQSFQNELLTEQERQLAILQIQDDTNQAKLKLEEDFQKQKQDLQEKQAAQLFEIQRLELEQRLGTEFEKRRITLEAWFTEQQKLAKGNAEILTQLDRTYSALRQEIAQAELNAKMAAYAGIFKNIQSLLQEDTIAHQGVTSAIIAIDTYKAAMAAYASLAAFPPAAFLAAGVAAGVGLKAIRDVWKVDPKAGVRSVSKPSGGGNQVAAPAIPEAQVSSSGGLVERNLSIPGQEATVIQVPVNNLDQITIDQQNLETIESLSSV
jgi:hypothetical protein